MTNIAYCYACVFYVQKSSLKSGALCDISSRRCALLQISKQSAVLLNLLIRHTVICMQYALYVADEYGSLIHPEFSRISRLYHAGSTKRWNSSDRLERTTMSG